MKIEVNLEKKYFYSILAVIIIVGGVFVVNAYGTNNPQVFGHSSGEVDVVVEGTTKTLQNAIDNDFCKVNGDDCPPSGGSGFTASEHTVNVYFRLTTGDEYCYIKLPSFSSAETAFLSNTAFEVLGQSDMDDGTGKELKRCNSWLKGTHYKNGAIFEDWRNSESSDFLRAYASLNGFKFCRIKTFLVESPPVQPKAPSLEEQTARPITLECFT